MPQEYCPKDAKRGFWYPDYMMKILLFLGITFFANPAYAACTGPVGAVGDVIFNTTHDVLQGCTARGWYAFHEAAAPPDPCTTGPIGTRCTSDGAIYAGDTVGGARMYAAACDHGMTWNGTACTGSQTIRQWKIEGTMTAGTTSLTDGVANTDAMATAGIALHPAAEACRNAGAEWYLPAPDELDLLYNNLVGVGWIDVDSDNFTDDFWFNVSGSFPAGSYWASSEINSNFAWTQLFSDGNQGGNFKYFGIAVRCVRR